MGDELTIEGIGDGRMPVTVARRAGGSADVADGTAVKVDAANVSCASVVCAASVRTAFKSGDGGEVGAFEEQAVITIKNKASNQGASGFVRQLHL